MPPMPDGRRNPFSGRQTDREDGAARIERLAGRSARVFGISTRILDEAGIPHMRDLLERKVTLCPADRIDDLSAYLEHRYGRSVIVVEVER